jgi:hypothetical protein
MTSECGDTALIANVEVEVEHSESFNRVNTTAVTSMPSHGGSIVHEMAWLRARSCWAPREASRELESQIATASAAAARRKDVCLQWRRPYKAGLGRRLALRWSDVGGCREAAGWRRRERMALLC